MSLMSYMHQPTCPASQLRQPGVDPECTCSNEYYPGALDGPITPRQVEEVPVSPGVSPPEQTEIDSSLDSIISGPVGTRTLSKSYGNNIVALLEQTEIDKLRHRLLITIKVAEQQQNAIKAALRYPNLIAFMGKQLFDLLEEAAGLSLNTEPQELVDLIKHRVDAGITSQYHPEFGTEWREPDGWLFRLFHEAQRQSWKEAKEEVRRLFADESLKHYNREEMETIILGNLNRLTPPELES